MQGLGKSFEHFSREYPVLNFYMGGSQAIKITLWMLRNTINMVFRAAIVCATVDETSSVDRHHICQCP
jgi:hypothetical protein